MEIAQCLCSDREHRQSPFHPEAVSVSCWDDTGAGRSPFATALAGLAQGRWWSHWLPWHQAAACHWHSMEGSLPAAQAAATWQPLTRAHAPRLLSPLISAALLHVRHAEGPGKDGVIQVHLLASRLKHSRRSSAITASVSALPRPCHLAALELPKGSCCLAGPPSGQ